MTSSGSWVRGLRPATDDKVSPVCSPELIRHAVDQIGAEAVQWAVQLGRDIALQCAEQFQEFGTKPSQIVTARLGIESATVLTLLAIDNPTGHLLTMSDDIGRAIKEWVQRGVPLKVVWAAVRQGHAWLVEKYTERCLAMVPRKDLPEELQNISRVMLQFMNELADSMGREYERENERWRMSSSALRGLRVRELLREECHDIAKAESDLEYQIRRRHHVGLVLWATQVDDVHPSYNLHEIAKTILTNVGAEQILLLAEGQFGLLGWGNSIRGFAPDQATSHAISDPRVRGSLGQTEFDVAGFVKTNRQAQRAQSLLDKLPYIEDGVITYRSVQLLSLLAENTEEMDEFVRTTLGALTEPDASTEALRNTLEAYLRLKHSPQAAANELFIARNTVNYRLKKAAELLGRSVDEQVLETWIALVIHERRTDTTK